MIFGDLSVFCLLFGTFAWYRLNEPALFSAMQPKLNQGIGLANTMLMLTGSWAVATALKAARAGRSEAAICNATLGILCGGGFIVMKALEYSEKIAAGLLPTTNDFFLFYFACTGLHLLHVIVAMGALGLFRHFARQPSTPRRLMFMEVCGLFWHLVDLIWVILFALFYLHR